MKTKTLKDIEKEADEFNAQCHSLQKSYAIFFIVFIFFYLVFSPSGLIQHTAFIMFMTPAMLSSYKYPVNNKIRYSLQALFFLSSLYVYSNYV